MNNLESYYQKLQHLYQQISVIIRVIFALANAHIILYIKSKKQTLKFFLSAAESDPFEPLEYYQIWPGESSNRSFLVFCPEIFLFITQTRDINLRIIW